MPSLYESTRAFFKGAQLSKAVGRKRQYVSVAKTLASAPAPQQQVGDRHKATGGSTIVRSNDVSKIRRNPAKSSMLQQTAEKQTQKKSYQPVIQNGPDSSTERAWFSLFQLPSTWQFFFNQQQAAKDQSSQLHKNIVPKPASKPSKAKESTQQAVEEIDANPKQGRWFWVWTGSNNAKQHSQEAVKSEGQSEGGLLIWRKVRQAPAQQQPQQEESDIPVQANHPSLQLLRKRVKDGSRPGQRQDGYKLGLVIEGGGMRGAVSGGSLLALHDLGLRDVFDAVYGSSAGAINATYFLSGQREGVQIYHEDIANKNFVDLARLMSGKQGPALNLSYLLDYVMNEVKPLDWDAVLASNIPLKVVASSLDALRPVILENFQDKQDLVQCLRASANIPEVAGGPITHRGERLVDAAVFEPVPFRTAIQDGCTHILTLCTRPPFRGGRLQKAMTDVFTHAIKRAVLSPEYMRDAWRREVQMMAQDGLTSDEMLLLSLEEGSHKYPFFNGAHVYPIFPGKGASFAPVCIDVPTLKQGVQEGRQAVARVLRHVLADSRHPSVFDSLEDFSMYVRPTACDLQQQDSGSKESSPAAR